MELGVRDHGEERSAEWKGGGLLNGAKVKSAKKQGSDGAVMLKWKSVFVGLVASAVLAATQDVPVKAGLAYFSCRADRGSLVSF